MYSGDGVEGVEQQQLTKVPQPHVSQQSKAAYLSQIHSDSATHNPKVWQAVEGYSSLIHGRTSIKCILLGTLSAYNQSQGNERLYITNKQIRTT